MTVPTLEEIEAAKVAMDDINSFTYLPGDTFVDGEGVTRDTVNGRLKKMGYAVPINYSLGIVFDANDNVKTIEENSIIYAPLPSSLPFTTSGTFIGDDDARFFVIQGLTNEQLVGDQSQSYEFNTLDDMKSNEVIIPDGKTLITKGRDTAGDKNGSSYLKTASVDFTGTPDEFRDFTLTDGSIAVEKSININFSSENNIAMHEFSRKIRMREVANVNWYGDSNSKRDTQLVQTSFKVAFFLPYGDIFVVGNVFDRSTSGFTAEDCYKTFTADNSADLAVIALGTNDGIFENMTSPIAGLKDYEKWMRLLIEREIIRNKGVLIVTPLPVRFDKQFETYTQAAPTDPTPTEHSPDIAVYEGVCKRLAIEYGCALFDSREWSSQFADSRMADATSSIGDGIQFGDPIHIFTPYTSSWGTSIAARVMCDNLIRPYIAVAGGAVQIRPNEDPFIAGAGFDATARYEYDASNAQHFATASGQGTPDWRALRLETGESIGYAFYVSQPMFIHPTFTALNGSNYNISLLVSTSAESYKQVDIDGQLDTKHGNNGNTSRSETVAADTVFNKIDAVASFRIMTPGWVLLTCKANTGNILWSGLEFESIDLFDYRATLAPENSFSVEADAIDLDLEDATRNIWVSNPLVQPVPGNTGWFIETLVRDIDSTLRMQRATTVSAGTTQKISIRQFASGSWSAWFAGN